MDLVGFLFKYDLADYKLNWLSCFNFAKDKNLSSYDEIDKGRPFWDSNTKTLTLPRDSVIRGEGTLKVIAAEDLIHQSGDGKDLNRPDQPGIKWSIWDNPTHFDSKGRPQPMMQAWTKEGISVIVPVPFDEKGYVVMEDGKVRLPGGLLHEDPLC